MFNVIQKILLFRKKLSFMFVELKLAKLNNTEWKSIKMYCNL